MQASSLSLQPSGLILLQGLGMAVPFALKDPPLDITSLPPGSVLRSLPHTGCGALPPPGPSESFLSSICSPFYIFPNNNNIYLYNSMYVLIVPIKVAALQGRDWVFPVPCMVPVTQ